MGAAFFWLALSIVLGGGLYLVDPVLGFAAAGMTALFVLFILGLGWLERLTHRFAPCGLCIGRGHDWIGSPSESPHAAIPFDAIRDVRLTRRRSTHGAAPGIGLVVEGGSTRLEFGGTAAHREALEWIRDYLNHRVWRRG